MHNPAAVVIALLRANPLGLTPWELARKLSRTVATTYSYVSQARRALRDMGAMESIPPLTGGSKGLYVLTPRPIEADSGGYASYLLTTRTMSLEAGTAYENQRDAHIAKGEAAEAVFAAGQATACRMAVAALENVLFGLGVTV
jgi:hypothetical protein